MCNRNHSNLYMLIWFRQKVHNAYVGLKALFGGQFTSLNQLLNTNYLVILLHRRSTKVSLETRLY